MSLLAYSALPYLIAMGVWGLALAGRTLRKRKADAIHGRHRSTGGPREDTRGLMGAVPGRGYVPKYVGRAMVQPRASERPDRW